MEDEVEANRRRWDELVAIHASSRYYDLEGFKEGRSTLLPVERNEVGPVEGKGLLHLQCHFGLDTLSWARLGAKVTGVDFSHEAILLARRIAAETGSEAEFVESDVMHLASVLDRKFDIVFTSYGALCWLPDLRRWAEVVRSALVDGGFLYLIDDHPLASIADEKSVGRICISYQYFTGGKAQRFEVGGTYTDRDAKVENRVSYEWTHTLSDVINAVIGAGLRIEYVHEFPFSFFPRFEGMERQHDGTCRFRDANMSFPLMFSLKAWKD